MVYACAALLVLASLRNSVRLTAQTPFFRGTEIISTEEEVPLNVRRNLANGSRTNMSITALKEVDVAVSKLIGAMAAQAPKNGENSQWVEEVLQQVRTGVTSMLRPQRNDEQPKQPEYYPNNNTSISSGGTCGGGNVGNKVCEDQSLCCSPWGYCGTTVKHCARACGNGNVGNGVCADSSQCCSKAGWCGNTAEHCTGKTKISIPSTLIGFGAGTAPNNEQPRNYERPEYEHPEGGPRFVVLYGENYTRSSSSSADSRSCPSNLPPEDIQTTMLFQTSLDRAWILKEHCARWSRDPIIAVVAVDIQQYHNRSLAKMWANPWRSDNNGPSSCPHLTLVEFVLSKEQAKPGKEPLNLLRNVGLNLAQTSHILVNDVDNVSSFDLDETIRTVLVKREQLRQSLAKRERTRKALGLNVSLPAIPDQENEAIVVPCFERHADCDGCKTYIGTNTSESYTAKRLLELNSSFIPKTFDDMHQCIAENKCEIVRKSGWYRGHADTRTEDWLLKEWYEEAIPGQGHQKGNIKELKCLMEPRTFEPYLVLRWCPSMETNGALPTKEKNAAPYYNEEFHGYGQDKVELTNHLRLMGYKYFILPDGFVVHHPHRTSKTRHIFDNDGYDMANRMASIFTKAMERYQSQYEGREVIPTCPEGQLEKEEEERKLRMEGAVATS